MRAKLVLLNIHHCSWYGVLLKDHHYSLWVFCIAFHPYSKRICEAWLYPVFTGDKSLLTFSESEIQLSSLIPTDPIIFLLYHSPSVEEFKPLSFVLIVNLKPLHFLEWEYPSENDVRKKQKCSTKYLFPPPPAKSLYFRKIVELV